MRAADYLLNLPEREKVRLGRRIDRDFLDALSDHRKRRDRCMEYYRKWRNRHTPNPAGEEDASNFQVPLLRWFTWVKWAKQMDSIFGDDAEIIAVPVGPSDERNVRKVGRYMTWRVLHNMKLVNPLAVFTLRTVLFGRAHAYAPWLPDKQRPGFFPLWPDDLVVPAEDVDSVQDFSWVIRRFRATPDDLLAGEDDGRYEGIRAHLKDIITQAQEGYTKNRDFQGDADTVKIEKDEAEGVTYQGSLSARESLEVQCWYGRWRLPKEGGAADQDPDELDLSRREEFASDLAVYYLPTLSLVIGVQRLDKIYPDAGDMKRPIVEASLCKDGSYWSPGFGEVLNEIENELTANENLGTDAGEISVGPLMFYRPATGFNPQQFRYEPRMAIPVDNPQTDVRIEHMSADLNFTVLKRQALIEYAENTLGISGLSTGRGLDRPNAPRTASQYITLIEEGNVRASIDVLALREDLSRILQHFWNLDSQFAGDKVFFRVTEEQANGLFKVREGGSYLTTADRGTAPGDYDFRVKFADSNWSREARKERELQLYGADLQNPLIAQNPRALWVVTNRLHEAMGDHEFKSIVPPPADLDLSISPKDELVRLLQGEEIPVRPMDPDEQHMLEHDAQIADLQQEPNPDLRSLGRLQVHYVQHARQMQQKKMFQALASEAMQAAGPLLGQLKQFGAMGQGVQAGSPAIQPEPGAKAGTGATEPGLKPELPGL